MKRKLGTEDLLTFFAVSVHCDKNILVDSEKLEKYTEIICPECDEPIMFRCSNGLWYSAGEKIFP